MTAEDREHLRIVFEREGDYQSAFDDFVAAMVRLHDLIHVKEFIPRQSSVDPANYRKADWVFARHW